MGKVKKYILYIMKHLQTISRLLALTIMTLPFSRIMAQDNSHKDTLSVDVMSLRVSYEVKYHHDIEEGESLEDDYCRTEKIITEAGPSLAHSYSVFEKEVDEQMEKRQADKGHRSVDFRALHAQFGEYYVNYPKGEQTAIFNMHEPGLYKYSESLPKMKWKIGKETKEVLGYMCTKATMSHRGRTWTAWFTNDIPVTRGPLFFGGLPGLILELQDSETHFTFTCDGIEKADGNTPIVFVNKDFSESTRDVVRKTEVSLLKHPTEFFVPYGITLRMDGQPFSPMPYNPIELK